MSVHIKKKGAYAQCSDATCSLPIHLPLDTVEEAERLPYHVLLSLIEVFDPPTQSSLNNKTWRDKHGYHHRRYGLPGFIGADGTLVWYRHGWIKRSGDKPTTIEADGTMLWEDADGQMHRLGGKPAIVHPDGSVDYYIDGAHVDEHGEFIPDYED